MAGKDWHSASLRQVMFQDSHSPEPRFWRPWLHIKPSDNPLLQNQREIITVALIDLEVAPDDTLFWQAIATLERLLGKTTAYREVVQELEALTCRTLAQPTYSYQRARYALNCIRIGEECQKRSLEFQLSTRSDAFGSDRPTLRQLYELGEQLTRQPTNNLADLWHRVETHHQTYKPNMEDLQVAYELAEQGVTTEIAVAAIATSIEAEMTAQKCLRQFTCLEKIATFDRLATAAFVDLMQTHPVPEIRLWAARCLVKYGHGK